jgi:hypothetical protein
MSELQFNDNLPELNFSQKKTLVDLLLKCPHVSNSKSFSSIIVQELPISIKDSYTQADSAKQNVMTVLNACLATSGGLKDLLEVIEYFDGKTINYPPVAQYLIEIGVAKPPQAAVIEEILNYSEYHTKNNEFNKQVREWLQIEGYEPEETVSEFPGYWIAQKDGIYHGILSYYNAEQDGSIFNLYIESASTFLQKQKNDGSFAIAFFVTCIKPNREASNKFLSKLGGEKVMKFLFFEETIKNPLGLGKYLNYWEDTYYNQPISHETELHKLRTLSQVYIPLRAERWKKSIRRGDEKEEFSLTLSSRYGLSTAFDYSKELLDDTLDIYIEDWLKRSQADPLAILATYGTGKSTLCIRLAAVLNRMRIVDYSVRIPIVVQLAKLARTNASWQSIAQALVADDDYFSSAPDVLKLRRLAEAGKAVFILDGFDEMAIQADEQQIQYNLSFFSTLINIPNNKVILTSRPEYFLESSRRRKYLDKYEELHLLLFNRNDIEQYVKRRMDHDVNINNFWQKISRIYDLSDLVQRAVFLEMVIKTFPQLQKISKKKNITRPHLYNAYLTEELLRQREKRDRDGRPVHTLQDKERLRIMELIALELFFQRKEGKGEGLNVQEIIQLAKKYNLLKSQEIQDVETIVRDVAGCSFLICPQDKYYFSHTSFQEYLLAKGLLASLQGRQPNVFKHGLISIPTLEFLAELIAEEDKSFMDVVEGWLDITTSKVIKNEAVTFEIFQQNLASLTLANKVVNLSEGKLSKFITCSEYQLFVQSQTESGLYVQPLQWRSFYFNAGDALSPVHGIQFHHAYWFCEWLQARHPGSYQYDLPNIKADQDLEYPGWDLGVWTATGRLFGLSENRRLSIFSNMKQLGVPENISINRTLSMDLREMFPEIDEIFNRPRPYDYSLAIATAFSLHKDFLDNLISSFAVDQTFKSVVKFINNTNYKLAIGLLKKIILKDVDESNKNSAIIAIDLIELRYSENFNELRDAYCKFICHLADIFVSFYSNNSDLENISKKRNFALSLKNWQIITTLRIKTQLPTWEGLRFIRRRKETEE